MENKNFVYSAKENLIYDASIKQQYIDAGSWPDDAVFISDEMAEEFSQHPLEKYRVAGKNGLPEWRMYPPPTKEKLVARAESDKQQLLLDASKIIAPLQDAVDLEMATEDEKKRLIAWKKYRVFVNRTDVSTAPDIDWPKKPD
ncbi:tail fiber assembly protein [Candidatus Arsenophonus triatominarum]|uniref:tail fiber assembly protein n=1 Tax=Candidatus Arsenophonus triatominarum TaxID=57911 RepID=UPI0007C44059|nr:tail fiber assembly protein [Candidatus Arsenophonus triatominarum]